jgi:hypothetical protein
MHIKKVFVELKRRKQVENLAVFVELLPSVLNSAVTFLIGLIGERCPYWCTFHFGFFSGVSPTFY